MKARDYNHLIVVLKPGTDPVVVDYIARVIFRFASEVQSVTPAYDDGFGRLVQDPSRVTEDENPSH